MPNARFWRDMLRFRPRRPLALAHTGDFALVALACVLIGAFGDWAAAEPGMRFTWSASGAWAMLVVLAAAGGAWTARLLGRPATAATFGIMLLVTPTALVLAFDLFGWATVSRDDRDYAFGSAWRMAAPAAAFVCLALSRHYVPDATRLRRWTAPLLVPALAMFLLGHSDNWSSYYYADEEAMEEAAAIDEQPRADADLDVDPEDLLAIQDGLVDAQLARLAAQRPGTIDLYALALGGDASESVFRNEVDLALRRFDTRLRTTQRSLRLLNHVDTLADTPLATRRNLARTLAGIGRIIDPAEDLVLVFLTSHGSRDHEWLVQLGDYALTQIVPEDLADAFDDAGIRWRIAIVSACYSGGWIEPLRSPTSLVITSARSDRTSFGCGRDAELTYFGRAFLSGALAVEDDLVAAFAAAAKKVAERERADGFEASEPQIAAGDALLAQLAAWRQQRPPVALSR